MLVSPEGWLIGLMDIKDAESGELEEPPWCFVKTQFGTLEVHVALAHMFTILKREFLPDLEVSEEGGYYETDHLAELARRHGLIEQSMDGLTAPCPPAGLHLQVSGHRFNLEECITRLIGLQSRARLFERRAPTPEVLA